MDNDMLYDMEFFEEILEVLTKRRHLIKEFFIKIEEKSMKVVITDGFFDSYMLDELEKLRLDEFEVMVSKWGGKIELWFY